MEDKYRLFARKFFKHLLSLDLIKSDNILIDYEVVDGFMETKESKEMFEPIKTDDKLGGYTKQEWIEMIDNNIVSQPSDEVLKFIGREDQILICNFELGIDGCGFSEKSIHVCRDLRKCGMCGN